MKIEIEINKLGVLTPSSIEEKKEVLDPGRAVVSELKRFAKQIAIFASAYKKHEDERKDSGR